MQEQLGCKSVIIVSRPSEQLLVVTYYCSTTICAAATWFCSRLVVLVLEYQVRRGLVVVD